MRKTIKEVDFLTIEFAKIMADSFGTIGYNQYFDVAEKLTQFLINHAQKVDRLDRQGHENNLPNPAFSAIPKG